MFNFQRRNSWRWFKTYNFKGGTKVFCPMDQWAFCWGKFTEKKHGTKFQNSFNFFSFRTLIWPIFCHSVVLMEVICMKKSQMEFYFGNEINIVLKDKKTKNKVDWTYGVPISNAVARVFEHFTCKCEKLSSEARLILRVPRC